jgi:DNA-binding NarL/FixJ family response regulator
MLIRLVIADDHPLLLDGLEALLARSPDVLVVERCTDGHAALEAVRALRPDIAILDINMPGLSGLQVLGAIRREVPGTQVVLLTTALSEQDLGEAVRLKVDGILLKDMPSHLILQCLHKVRLGGRWLENRAAQQALEATVRRSSRVTPETGLTRREVELVRLVADGLRNKEIASQLELSEVTVKTHLRNIYRKLGLGTRIGVRRYAEARGLL